MSARPLVSVTAPLICFHLQAECPAKCFVESVFPAPFPILASAAVHIMTALQPYMAYLRCIIVLQQVAGQHVFVQVLSLNSEHTHTCLT